MILIAIGWNPKANRFESTLICCSAKLLVESMYSWVLPSGCTDWSWTWLLMQWVWGGVGGIVLFPPLLLYLLSCSALSLSSWLNVRLSFKDMVQAANYQYDAEEPFSSFCWIFIICFLCAKYHDKVGRNRFWHQFQNYILGMPWQSSG